MQLDDLLSLIGGLALFLYGMHMMSEGLEQTAGDKLQSILEKLTKNRFLAIVVGALITILIQSSSATTVMVIGFVSSGLMPLNKAVWIIMGANIGTTVTGQLIALDVGEIAPIFAFIGAVMVTFLKNRKANHIGMVIAGLGFLFIGMDMMSGSMKPLRDSEAFIQLMTTFSNPLFGIAAGAIFTAIIQSSSASIGILQSLANNNLISLQSAAYVLYGQNIGTCITAFLASLGGNRNAKRAALIHMLFNCIGTLIFLAVCLTFPFTDFVASLTPDAPMSQIANIHTIFNITTTLILLPFGNKIAQFTLNLIPLLDNEKTAKPASFVSELHIGTSAMAVSQLKKDVQKMMFLSKESFTSITETLIEGAKCNASFIKENENKINSISYRISQFMTKLSKLELQEMDQQRCNIYFKLSMDIERIGDHIMNLMDYGKMLNRNEIHFDNNHQQELKKLAKAIHACYEIIEKEDLYTENDKFLRIEELEQQTDDLNIKYRNRQIQRLENDEIDPKTAIIYADLLSNIERIADHMLNIAQAAHTMEISLQITANSMINKHMHDASVTK